MNDKMSILLFAPSNKFFSCFLVKFIQTAFDNVTVLFVLLRTYCTNSLLLFFVKKEKKIRRAIFIHTVKSRLPIWYSGKYFGQSSDNLFLLCF